MKWLIPLLAIVACKKSPAPAAEPTPVSAPAVEPAPESASASEVPAPRPPPSVEQLQGVARKLSVRDPEPECEAMESEMESDPLATWLYVIETVSKPAYAPMRAAECVIRGHAEAASDTLVSWVSDPDKAGLGALVRANSERLPDEVRARVEAVPVPE